MNESSTHHIDRPCIILRVPQKNISVSSDHTLKPHMEAYQRGALDLKGKSSGEKFNQCTCMYWEDYLVIEGNSGGRVYDIGLAAVDEKRQESRCPGATGGGGKHA